MNIKNPTLKKSLLKTANFILSIQKSDGAIPWFENGKLDPWDHTEAAMGLCVAGHHRQAELAYSWLRRNQLSDGSWHTNYTQENNYQGQTHKAELKETNFIAYIATGVWHYYLITKDITFLNSMFPSVEAAINFVLAHQSRHGEIAWAIDGSGKRQNDALITACSSILRSLDCACKIAKELKMNNARWQTAATNLMHALKHKPERFDRTWESKARFSMDWYYPILAGIYSPTESRGRIDKRWPEFVEDELGCRCVSDEPWVTMAETCELVIALSASGDKQKAKELFATLKQWCDDDGGYWTGYVFRDKTIWPEEKTTWTAGAVLLAADTLFDITPASGLFCQPLTINAP